MQYLGSVTVTINDTCSVILDVVKVRTLEISHELMNKYVEFGGHHQMYIVSYRQFTMSDRTQLRKYICKLIDSIDIYLVILLSNMRMLELLVLFS